MGDTALAGRPHASQDVTCDDEVVVREHRPTAVEMVRAAWRHRSLIPRLGLRQLVKGYAGTKLGRLWLLIRPVAGIFGMGLLFGSVLKAPSDGVPYLVFLLVGMCAWLTFERIVFWATRSFDIYRKVAGRLDIPLLVVPIAPIATVAVELGIMFGLTVATVTFFWIVDGNFAIRIGPSLALGAAGLVLAVVVAWGVGVWLATLNAKARDVRLGLRFILPLWLYATPVLYPSTALPGKWRLLASLNPVTAPVELVKKGVLGVGTVRLEAVVVSLVSAALLLASAVCFLVRLSPTLLRAESYDDDDEDELL